MSEWKRCTLADLGEIVGGATPSTKNESYYGGDIAWITPKDLSTFQGRYISHGERNITSEGFKNSSARLIPPHSVLFTSRAPIGYVAIAENEVCTNQGFKSVVPNNETDYLFLYYLLVHNRDRIENMGSGTTFKEVSGSVMKQIEVDVPIDKSEQRAIAETLGALDDKIENNTKINHHLERMAQAIFKSWFVDFEPFADGELVESELGEIPADWRIASLKEVCSNITDGVHNTVVDDASGEYFLLSCKNIKDGAISTGATERRINKDTFQKLRKRTRLEKGDVLLSSVGTIGEMALLLEEPTNVEFQRSVAMLKPNTNLISSYFLYQSLCWQKAEIVHTAHGAVQQCLFLGDINSFTILLPDKNSVNEYTKLVDPLFRLITDNRRENASLVNIRDALLPKLMSGELSVANIQAAK